MQASRKTAMVTAAAVIIALVVASSAAAEKYFSLTIESKEIIYDPQTRVAQSMVDSVVRGDDFELLADRLQVDFRKNLLRASGNVLLYTSPAHESPAYSSTDIDRELHERYFGDSHAGFGIDGMENSGMILPRFDENESRMTNFFGGRDIVIDLEEREAMIIPDKRGAKPVTVDLVFSRVVPSLKRINSLVIYNRIPQDDILLCFELQYSSAGKFVMHDVTFVPSGAPQYYTALVVSESPDLEYNAFAMRNLYARKSYTTDSSGLEEETPHFWLGSTAWLSSHPRHQTWIDLDAHASEKEGYRYLEGEINQTISFSNFGFEGDISGSNVRMDTDADLFTYTPSRNNMWMNYYRQEYEAGNELTAMDHVDDTGRRAGAGVELWDEDYTISFQYNDDKFHGKLNYMDSLYWRSEEDEDKDSSFHFELRPVKTFLKGYWFGLEASAARRSDDFGTYYSVLDEQYDYNADTRAATIAPKLMSGVLHLNNRMFIVQDIAYKSFFINDDYTETTYRSGSIYKQVVSDKEEWDQKLEANTRLLIPLGNSAMMSFKHQYADKSGYTPAGSSATLSPGLSFTWNRQDYIFVSYTYDFAKAAEEWTMVEADLVLRRKNGFRAFAAYDYDLVNDDVISEVFGLSLDIGRATLMASYSDLDSDFRIGLFTRNYYGAHRGSMLEKAAGYGY